MEKAITHKDPLARIPKKSESEIRYVSFNVNGAKTLFHYNPWNQLQGNFNAFLAALGGDIISLQELKIQLDGVAQFGLPDDYRSFISIPSAKKGYSGVGLYVRLPKPDDPPQVKQALTVIKAEEGITGRLKQNSTGKRYCDIPKTESIGGYLSDEAIAQLVMTEQQVLSLDLEGRCCVVELANNTVVFSLYCPANSMATSEGQTFRLNFLEMMFQRCANLHKLGKKVVVMGDINVSPDLIDSAEGINELIKTKKVINNLSEGGEEFEQKNEEACLSFQSSAVHRSLLHRYTVPSLSCSPRSPTQFLNDTTRYFKSRELALYTVWNTMTNARQSNFGSRIDLILFSSEADLKNVARAEILPFLHGSDHCPIMTDLSVAHQDLLPFNPVKKLSFEARTHYKLIKHRDISTMFSMASAKRSSDSLDTEGTHSTDSSTEVSDRPPTKLRYVSRKVPQKESQQSIQNFFTKSPKTTSSSESVDQNSEPKAKVSESVNVVTKFASLVYDKPPVCLHNEKCSLKTSMTQATKGKKFWCCSRNSKGSSTEIGEHRCNFFEWARKPLDPSNMKTHTLDQKAE